MKKVFSRLTLFCMAAVLLTAACSKNPKHPDPSKKLPNTVILQWNDIAYEAFGGASYQHSLMASRINAMTHIAMHDAVNAVYPRFETYAFHGKEKAANPIVAAAVAAYSVLLHEMPAKKQFLDSALNNTLESQPDDASKALGLTLGKQAADAIIAQRNTDGSNGDIAGPIEPSDIPGVYQAVPPFDIVFAPFWEDLKPFGLQSPNQFRPQAQPALDSKEYTDAFNEVKKVGRINSNTRTPEQLSYAQFWYEFSEAGWNRIARVVAKQKELDLFEAARLFALVDIALADAYIAGWDAKGHYNFWRPYTAIRKAATDGNPETIADESWEPALPTPPVQDYPSTHSALGKAAAVVLARILGDTTSFTFESVTAVPASGTRSFSSFSQAAAENADSRVMAGIHFRFACDAGLALGNDIGNWVVDKHLKPLK